MRLESQKKLKRGTRVMVNRFPAAAESATVVKLDKGNRPNKFYLLKLKNGNLLHAHRSSFKVK